jgi:lycopene cyclase domain-containing protein
MSYAAFLAIFLCLPLALLFVVLRRRLRDGRLWKLMGLLVLLALAYMAPWDHLAAVWGLWTWAPLQTWQVRFWAIPLEEYLFCLLETLLAGTLLYALLASRRARLSRQPEREPRA